MMQDDLMNSLVRSALDELTKKAMTLISEGRHDDAVTLMERAMEILEANRRKHEGARSVSL